ncbi:hypothetical protein DRW07_08380 [Alteromonas sediminis]|uniref:Solute-binding protein family 3/N-terminal domain-containing protein n=1 Tax=Alteromonas sediminis TaxID=2259342 RepID=A0A3N5Y2E3_9ALTE|nr:transporter substrate-binding domain-containing protein [Alteromonas sediminis]RPJ67520.1 hypothetical protein DRW07_08380 [Alteromonas sediminis]
MIMTFLKWTRLRCILLSKVALTIFCFSSQSIAETDHKWLAVTENFPPYSYMEKGRAVGYSTELVESLAKSANLALTIELLPWSRAMRKAQSQPNVLIFSMLRTSDREDKYHWIGAIDDMSIYVWELKEPQLDTHKDTLAYAVSSSLDRTNVKMLETSLGVHRNSVITVETTEQLLGMLVKQRVHRIVMAENIWKRAQKTLDPLLAERMQRVALLATRELYVAASIQTSLEEVERLKAIFANINRSQQTIALRESYRLY